MQIQPIRFSLTETRQLNKNSTTFKGIHDSAAAYDAVKGQATSAIEKLKDDLTKESRQCIKNKHYKKAITIKERIRDICFEQGKHDDAVQLQRGINELYEYI